MNGQHVHRLTFRGSATLTWVVHRHAVIAALLGIAVIAVWLLHRRRSLQETLEPLMVLGILIAAQGLVGTVQYELRLPADMVWVHVALATASWLALLWVAAAAGSLAPRRTPSPALRPADPPGRERMSIPAASAVEPVGSARVE